MTNTSVFDKAVSQLLIQRINQLKPNTAPTWGKMDVAKMLAHCNVTYEYIYDNKYKKPGFFKSLILKLFVKNIVVSDKSYKKNSPTAPEFIIKSDKEFDNEKSRLIQYIEKTQVLGASHFDGKESHSFGILTSNEWNNMMYKHLDHHLTQFGV